MLAFPEQEYVRRRRELDAALAARSLDGILLFAPESQYWLTGYDTFGYCFFQCLVVGSGGETMLLTRSADLRQAEATSIISDIRVWADRAGARPAGDLATILTEMGLSGRRIGVEWDTHGLTAANGRALAAALEGTELVDASDLVSALRLVKSPAELACVQEAAALADAAWAAALPLIGPGGDEGEILAAMQGTILARGGDYPGNPFIVSSGPDALLVRISTGRRKLSVVDQLTLEWAGTWRLYHAARMETVLIGPPREGHAEMHAVAKDALLAAEAELRPGRTMGDVYAAQAAVIDGAGMGDYRLKACGYALGTRYAPSWMEREMFYEGNETEVGPGMVFFLHMILLDAVGHRAMSLGRTSLVGTDGAEPLGRQSLVLERR